MKDTIEIDGIIYYKKAPNTINNYDFINRRLQKLREFLEDVCPRKDLSNLVYDLYFYEDTDLNAITFNTEDGYVIAFTTSSITTIYDDLKNIFNNTELLGLFHLQHDKDYLIKACFDYMTYFIALHELLHIINGHCSYLSNKSLKCSEKWVTLDESQNLESQILECNADISAIRVMTNYILFVMLDYMKNEKKDKNEIIPNYIFEIQTLIFSIYNIFLLFSKIDGDRFEDCIHNFLFYDHPYPSIRMIYSLNIIEQEISRFITDEQIDYVVKESQKFCITYDRLFYAKNDFKKSLQAIAYTEAGSRHFARLYNGWNDYIDTLKPYSFYKLQKNEVIDKIQYWVSNDGEIIYPAIEVNV